jgi:hypothetical protein
MLGRWNSLNERATPVSAGGAHPHRYQDARRPVPVTVQARSALHLDVALSQQSRLPGTFGRLRATRTDSGIPLGSSAALHATVTAPDGTTTTLV